MSASIPSDRGALLRSALRLEWFTIGWNVIEGVVAIAAALTSGSVALLAFGLDSFVETASGWVLVWRLRAEGATTTHEQVERLERRAQRLVAGSLVLLAAWVAFDATTALLRHERPTPSVVGIILPTVSMGVMWWLARAKRRIARSLGSRALEADALQTSACWWLSLVTLVGVASNALVGWWWLDPVAALGIAVILLVEARKAWRAEGCCQSVLPLRLEPEADTCCKPAASETTCEARGTDRDH